MSTVEEKLLHTLNELDAAARSMPTANPKPNLLAIFAQLDQLASQLPGNTNPQLLHFVRNKSYEKARSWLANRAAAPQPGKGASL